MLAIIHLALLIPSQATAEVGLGATETAFAGVLVTAILGALGMLIRWIARKSGSELLGLALGRLQWAVGVAVRDVYQTYVEALKATSSDGKLTGEEKGVALEAAISKARGLLGLDGIKLLVKALGAKDDAIGSFLAPHIEAEIADAKKAGAPPADPSPPSVVV